MNQPLLALLDQPDITADVILMLASDLANPLVGPPFVVQPFELAGEVHAARFVAGDVFDQRLEQRLFAAAGDHFGQYRLAAELFVGQQPALATDQLVLAGFLKEPVVDADRFVAAQAARRSRGCRTREVRTAARRLSGR